jgi:predicted RNA methylase
VRSAASELVGKLRRLKYSIASTGLRRGLSDLALHLLTYKPEHDYSFDRSFGTDTAGKVQPEDLGIAEDGLRKQAILYLPSPARVTRWMLDNIGIAHRHFAFIDLGCGKGRVVLVASHYPFQRIIGVEISAELAAIARGNVSRYRPAARACDQIEIALGDATRFEFPASNVLLHFYHPFEPAVTRAVLAQLERSLQASPRQAVVAYLTYAAAVESIGEVFADFPRFQRIRHERSVLGQYDWLFYATSGT